MSASATITAPTPGRGAQQPVAERADVQDVLREDRQQRGRAAQQHGDEIERHRAEQRGRAQDEANALERLGEGRRARLVGRGAPARSTRGTKRTAAAPRPAATAATTNGTGEPSRCSSPAATGPAIVPNCHTDAFMAITRGNSSVVTAAASIGP